MKEHFTPDYHWTMCKGTSKEKRNELGTGDIWINAALCLKCKTYVRSLNRHCYRTCKCGAVGVDGGSHYLRRMGNPEDYVNIVEEFEKND